MDWVKDGTDIFVRVDPGERLVESLTKTANDVQFPAAAIISGVGMLDGIQLGFFDVAIDDYERSSFPGIFDLSVVLGNIVHRDGAYVPHVHAVFNDASHATYSGHVMEATCHITMEIFLSTTEMALQRVKLPGCPATRIIRGETA